MNDKITIDRAVLDAALDAIDMSTGVQRQLELYKVAKLLRAALAAPQPSDFPKIGCVNHDCDKCKATMTPAELADRIDKGEQWILETWAQQIKRMDHQKAAGEALRSAMNCSNTFSKIENKFWTKP